jgi:hypothetical protein
MNGKIKRLFMTSRGICKKFTEEGCHRVLPREHDVLRQQLRRRDVHAGTLVDVVIPGQPQCRSAGYPLQYACATQTAGPRNRWTEVASTQRSEEIAEPRRLTTFTYHGESGVPAPSKRARP